MIIAVVQIPMPQRPREVTAHKIKGPSFERDSG